MRQFGREGGVTQSTWEVPPDIWMKCDPEVFWEPVTKVV